jgi:signal transduction histidine kinase
VKNPLAGLLIYSLHLKSKAENFSENEIYLVDKIVDTINHLNSRVEQILGFARPINLTVRSENLNVMINDVLDLVQPQIAANKIEVRLSLEQQPVYVRVDQSSMRGALLNLILNAIEAMPAGGTLSIAVNQTGDTVRLDLTDTGRGIEDEEARKIFEPFYTTKAQGLGLGMPYAKKIIDQHGGTISLSSRLGVGTTISLTLHAGQQEVNDVS